MGVCVGGERSRYVSRLPKGRQSRINIKSTAVAESTFLREFCYKGIAAYLTECRVTGSTVYSPVMAIWLGGMNSSDG